VTQRDSVLNGAARGAGVGAVALSALVVGLYALYSPAALNDGQFVFVIYFFTMPVGAAVGAAIGIALSLRGPDDGSG
jgi:hypothetical protein